MPKSPAERKAAQRARQAAAGGKKLELALDSQELEMLALAAALASRAARDAQQEKLVEILTAGEWVGGAPWGGENE